jgi:hypothetical protein
MLSGQLLLEVSIAHKESKRFEIRFVGLDLEGGEE